MVNFSLASDNSWNSKVFYIQQKRQQLKKKKKSPENGIEWKMCMTDPRVSQMGVCDSLPPPLLLGGRGHDMLLEEE